MYVSASPSTSTNDERSSLSKKNLPLDDADNGMYFLMVWNSQSLSKPNYPSDRFERSHIPLSEFTLINLIVTMLISHLREECRVFDFHTCHADQIGFRKRFRQI